MNNFDVIIIGGGIIGVCSAFELAKVGATVLILEKRDLGSGASGCSAAMLECQTDAHRGEPFLSLARPSVKLFPEYQAEVELKTGLDFQYEQCGILNLAFDEDESIALKEEVQSEQKKGFSAQWMDQETLEKKVPQLDPENHGGALFEEDGQVNGERFLSAMIKTAEYVGVQILRNIGSTELLIEGGKITGVKSESEKYYAGHVIVAIGAWCDSLLKSINLNFHVVPVRGQLVVYDTPKRLLPFPLFWRKTKKYVVPKQDGYSLVGTTVENVGYDEQTTDEAKESLVRFGRSVVPAFSRAFLRGCTAGLRPVSPDFLPVLGAIPGHENVIMATGHFRNGILLAPITAKIMASVIMGIDLNIDLRPFAPDRLLS